jgi:hypothetical protein
MLFDPRFPPPQKEKKRKEKKTSLMPGVSLFEISA